MRQQPITVSTGWWEERPAAPSGQRTVRDPHGPPNLPTSLLRNWELQACKELHPSRRSRRETPLQKEKGVTGCRSICPCSPGNTRALQSHGKGARSPCTASGDSFSTCVSRWGLWDLTLSSAHPLGLHLSLRMERLLRQNVPEGRGTLRHFHLLVPVSF